jgi:hypothetical protein
MNRIVTILLAVVLLIQSAMAGVCTMTKTCMPAVPEQGAQRSARAHHHGHLVQTPDAAMKAPACSKSFKMESKVGLRDSNPFLVAHDEQAVSADVANVAGKNAQLRSTPLFHAPVVIPLRI